MCRTLNIPKSLVYYKKRTKVVNTELENAIISIFRESKNNYVSRKIKYVNVAGKWNCIYLLINLFNREIVGYSAGAKKGVHTTMREQKLDIKL